MLFRAPGKSTNFEYSNPIAYQPVQQMNQKSLCMINNSFTMGQKCSSQQKLSRNYQQRYVTYQNPSTNIKTQPPVYYDQEKYRPPIGFRSPTYMQMNRPVLSRQGSINMPFEQQCLILRKQKSQMSQKIKRVQDELQTKENLIRGKQRQIQELKQMQNNSSINFNTNTNMNMNMNYNGNNFNTNMNGKQPFQIINDLKSQKQKLYYQVIDLQTEIHKMQERYQKMQRQHYGLAQKYDDLTSKSALQISKKVLKQEQLQSELTLTQKRSERIKTQYQKQINNLKQKMQQLQNESSKNNKSTVMSYNLSTYSDSNNNYNNSLKTQPDLESSKILDIQKLQCDIRQKNQMIKYLQVQCLKDKKRESQKYENQSGKIVKQYQQCKKQLAKYTKEVQSSRKQIAALQGKITSGDKMREELIKQVRDLQYLLKELRDKLCKTMEQNRTINKRQRENNDKLQIRNMELQSQLLKSSAKMRSQIEETQKNYQKMLGQYRDKTQSQLTTKQSQLKDYCREKQQLLTRLTQYQQVIKQNQESSSKYQDLKTVLKKLIEQKKSLETKQPIGETQNIQKQLKIKTDQLTAAENSKKTLLQQISLTKDKFEEQVQQLCARINKLQIEKKRVQQQKNRIQAQLDKMKLSYENKIVQIQKQANQGSQCQIESLTKKNTKAQQKYESTIRFMREQQRKLKNMIADQERDNLNLTIQVQNQKIKYNQVVQKLKTVKQEKKKLKQQNQRLSQKSISSETNVASAKRIQIQGKQKQIQQLNRLISTFKNDKQNIQKDNRVLKQKIVSLQKSITELTVKNQSLCEQLSTKTHQLQQTLQNLTQIQQLLLQSQCQIAQLNVRLQNLSGQQSVKSNIQQQLNKTLSIKCNIILQQQKKIQAMITEMDTYTQQSNDQNVRIEEISKKLQEKDKYISNLNNLLKESQGKVTKYSQEIKQMNIKLQQSKSTESVVVKQLQQKVLKITKQTQLQKSQLQLKISSYQTQIQQKLGQINSLKSIIKQRESIECDQRKSLDEKDRYNRQIQLQLQEMTRQMLQIKQKFIQLQIQISQKPRSTPELQQQNGAVNKNLRISKLSAVSNSQSFIADFIQIDKNALLHICDLLAIEPVQGQLLRTIIEVIENGNFITIAEYYREILQLFGVQGQGNQKMQEKLIGQVKNFRETLAGLLDKVGVLEARNQGLIRENHRLSKNNTKIEHKEVRIYQLGVLVDQLNKELINVQLCRLNKKKELEVEDEII